MTYLTASDIDLKFKALTESQYIVQGAGTLLNSGYEEKNCVVMDSANGPFMNDTLGNRYIDAGMGAGSMILGHAPQTVVDKISKQASKGTIFVHPSRSAFILKQKVLENLEEKFTGVIFSSSGSEATLRAIRLARAFSGKTGIGLFSGGWHGSHDMVLVADDYDTPENCPKSKPLSTGIPKQLHDDVLMLPYNNEKAFDLIRLNAHKLAVVIVEPVQGSNPRSDITPFLNGLSEVCQESGVLLAFDEIITGYRLSLGGATACFSISPDIITYGKILGGGLPLGAVVISDKIAAGVFGKNTSPFFTGGTFSANPLSMEAGIETLQCLKICEYGYINALAEQMRKSCNDFFTKGNYPLQMIGCNSISRVIFTKKMVLNRRERDQHELLASTQTIFRKLMVLNGVLHPSNGIIFLSFAHKKNHVEKIIISIKKAVRVLAKIDCFSEINKKF